MKIEYSYHIDGLKAVRLLAIINQLKTILRPSALKDMIHFIDNISSTEELERFMNWAKGVLAADYEERYFSFRPRTEKAMQAIELKIFRKPKRAFEIRWMLRSTNRRATRRAYKNQSKEIIETKK